MAAGSETTERRRRSAGATSTNGQARDGAQADGTVEIATEDLERLLAALRAAQAGEAGVRLPARKRGLLGEIATAFN
ncbi:MAG: hypothetical protein QOF50_1216, partial [Gaiellaceae bacterium]|nr:hypothetical protein [Gaiellaceae bacterium]